MIKTKFDVRFREIPFDTNALTKAQKAVSDDLSSALKALENDPTELDRMDYFRVLSRASDLRRFEFNYEEALQGFEAASEFWLSVDWHKAAFLCDLKVALCRAYFETNANAKDFDPLLERLEGNEELSIYRFFFYQFRGQVLAFHEKFDLAESDFRFGLNLSQELGKKKQVERFTFFIEKIKR